jgi:hypothetical protein
VWRIISRSRLNPTQITFHGLVASWSGFNLTPTDWPTYASSARTRFPIEHATALAQGIPNARLIEWDRVGHEIPVQLAAELGQQVVQIAE